jgi:hypothetical protein
LENARFGHFATKNAPERLKIVPLRRKRRAHNAKARKGALKLKNSQRHNHRHGHGGDAFFATDEAHGFVGCGLDAYPRRVELECDGS